MFAIEISLDEEGNLHLGRECPPLLRILLEDIGCHLKTCDRILAAIEDVRRGRQPEYRTTTDTTQLLVTPDGASLRIAAKLTRNSPVPVDLDELESAVRRLRDFTQALPEDQRW